MSPSPQPSPAGSPQLKRKLAHTVSLASESFDHYLRVHGHRIIEEGETPSMVQSQVQNEWALKFSVSACRFFTQLSIHFLWYLLGEFFRTSRPFIFGDYFLFFHDWHVFDQLVLLSGEIGCRLLLTLKRLINSNQLFLVDKSNYRDCWTLYTVQAGCYNCYNRVGLHISSPSFQYRSGDNSNILCTHMC